MMIGLDQSGQVYDLYYPFIGLENHTAGNLKHKIGIFVEGSMSWIDDGSWQINTSAAQDTMCSSIVAVHAEKKVELHFEDVVYNEKNIFIRKITVRNLHSMKRAIKLYINHQFEIYEAHRGDTALYDPKHKVLIHYKGRRVFMMNADHDALGIDDYSVGLLGIEGREGTYKDAEDGKLEQNPVEHGFVDSVAGFTCEVKGSSDYIMYYWMVIGTSLEEAHELNAYVLEKTPAYLIQSTESYWQAWVNKQNFTFFKLDPDIVRLFKQSLLIIRAHVDNHGAIIASGDSDLLKQGRDYYNYMWPRDGALTAIALERAGYTHVTKQFFLFCEKLITDEGYLRHKYRADGSFAASWHPWVQKDPTHLPIQEDETALVVYALWQYYINSKDLEFVETLYNSLIKKAAEFMIHYMDPETGLPSPSYDLWEEKYGTSTFTVASVYAGLTAASRFAGLLGKSQSELKYKTFAEKIKKALLEKLYNEKDGYFYKMIYKDGAKYVVDATVDASSAYALFAFDVLPLDDERLDKAMQKVREKLTCNTEVGGIVRYENDYYFRVSHDVPGNPWVITTLWMAQYYLRKAQKEEDFDEPVKWLKWVVKHALPSGILAEQLNPFTGAHLSATPLTWSHAEYVNTVLLYLEKLDELGLCDKCYPVQ